MTSITTTIISLVVTTILLVNISPASADYVKDESGERLYALDSYLIIPALNGTGLTYNNSTTSPDNCPLYVTQDVQTFGGTPVGIKTALLRILEIPEKSQVYIDFQISKFSPLCGQQAGRWKLGKDFHVTAAGEASPGSETAWFQFEKLGYNDDVFVYLINYCDLGENCMTVGLSKEDGRLGVKNVLPLPVIFRKTYNPFNSV